MIMRLRGVFADLIDTEDLLLLARALLIAALVFAAMIAAAGVLGLALAVFRLTSGY